MNRGILLLLALTATHILNVMDRYILTVLADPVSKEFQLSDTQIGLLIGLSFSLVYSAAALPLARLSDRGFHRSVLAWCIVVWSVMTSVCGLAQNFVQMAAARLGVAAGEAGLQPTAHALICRQFSEQRRGMALGVFSLGIPLGSALGAALAGVLAEKFGWRFVFLLVGPIAIFLIPLILILAPRGGDAPKQAKEVSSTGVRVLWAQRFYRELLLGNAISTLFGFGFGAFFAVFLIRTHGATTKEAGLLMAVAHLASGILGMLGGGWLHDWAVRRNPRAGLYPAVVCLVASCATATFAVFVQNLYVAVALLALALAFYHGHIAPTYAVALKLVPAEARATSSALMGLSTTLIGATAGPFAVGLISDVLKPVVADDALKYAIIAVAACELIGAVLLWRASRTAPRANLQSVPI